MEVSQKLIWKLKLYTEMLQNTSKRYLFSAWCPLKGHTYLKVSHTCFQLRVCLGMSDLLVDTTHKKVKMILVNFKTNNVVFIVFLCLFFLVKKPKITR